MFGSNKRQLRRKDAKTGQLVGGNSPDSAPDCPELTAERLRVAAARLAGHDAVLHRAEDGGYPLLGLRAFDAKLFFSCFYPTPQAVGRR